MSGVARDLEVIESSGALEEAMKGSFDSFEAFKERFAEAATPEAVFSSGWRRPGYEAHYQSNIRKEREAMAHSEIMQRIEDLSEEREKLVAREGSHHASAKDHQRLDDIDHTLGVLWDLRRREIAGENVRLDEDFLDRYVVSPGDDAPGDYRSSSLP